MEQRQIDFATIDIGTIEPHPRNVRQGDIGAISQSLKAHGQYRPIVVDRRTNQILAGNHTWKAAKSLGWQQIAVGFIETKDDDDALRILLADNRTNDLATYDDAGLAELLNQLVETNIGLEGTLFDKDDLDALLKDLGDFELPIDIDDIPEDAPAVSKLGDVWLLGKHRVMCGDATNVTDVNSLMAGSKADMVFTDPPYGISIVKSLSVGGGGPVGGVEAGRARVAKGVVDGDKVVKTTRYRPVINDDSMQTAIDAYNLCKTIGIGVQIWWGGNYYASALSNSSCWIVWDKENTGNFADAELAWTNQPTATRIFKHMWNGMLRASERGAGVRVHPTQKPIALAVWCFEQYGNIGDIVLDLFGGSGSTLIAAQETNRTAYLMELDPHYVDVICARYQKHTGIEPVLEATGAAHDFSTE